jgi:hypothetical protein
MINDNKKQKLSDSTNPLLLIARVMCRTFSQMFFWCGVFWFDAKKKEYGGFNHFIAGKIFRWRLCYLETSITYKIGFRWIHNNNEYYYDGYHNHILFGCFRLSYGT